jgi:hypothetical protein
MRCVTDDTGRRNPALVKDQVISPSCAKWPLLKVAAYDVSPPQHMLRYLR